MAYIARKKMASNVEDGDQAVKGAHYPVSSGGTAWGIRIRLPRRCHSLSSAAHVAISSKSSRTSSCGEPFRCKTNGLN